MIKYPSHPVRRMLYAIREILILMVSMAGYVPKNATVPRTIAMALSLAFALYLSHFQANNTSLAVGYFIAGEILYIGFAAAVLSKNGLRHRFIRSWGENNGYLNFEAILGFLFLHNGICIGYMASSDKGSLMEVDGLNFLLALAWVAFITGFAIKIMAAKAVTIEIYYWKDMFLGRKISDFVVSGPYKYLKNPMYGAGQLPAYASAIWYGSAYGLIAAFLNQFLIFSFYFLIEKKFINRTYLYENKS